MIDGMLFQDPFSSFIFTSTHRLMARTVPGHFKLSSMPLQHYSIRQHFLSARNLQLFAQSCRSDLGFRADQNRRKAIPSLHRQVCFHKCVVVSKLVDALDAH